MEDEDGHEQGQGGEQVYLVALLELVVKSRSIQVGHAHITQDHLI